eukprot:4720421-Prymnesium_polylepis.1
MFAAMDLNSDGMVSKEELSKLCKAALVDPEAPMVQAAFQTADFSGQGGGGDGSLSVDEIIIFNLEQTAGECASAEGVGGVRVVECTPQAGHAGVCTH